MNSLRSKVIRIMLVLSGLTVNDVNSNSRAPVEALHWPGLGSAVRGGAGSGGGVSGDGSGVGVTGGGVSVGGVGAVTHPAKIMLTTITTANKAMINFFIFTSFSVVGIGDEDG